MNAQWKDEYNAPFYGPRKPVARWEGKRRMPWDWYYWPELILALTVVFTVLWSVFVPGWLA